MGMSTAPESDNVGDEESKSCPAGFEGFEKRLEVEFHPASIHADPAGRGLRALPRADIYLMLDAAKCSIVAKLSNEEFDSYVLSESSLFIYPWKMVLKTCGTTQILKAIPYLLDFAEGLSLVLRQSKYTRGTFLFPSEQPFPHGSFGEEVRYLDQYFGKLGSGSFAYVMGNPIQFPNWHVYTASENDYCPTERTYTLEMCMTQLDVTKAAQFLNEDGTKSGLEMRRAAGIEKLLPHSKICDFAFDPCGYSMNSIEGSAHSTMHVTPETSFSFASFETMGYGPRDVNLHDLIGAVTSIFKPGSFSLYLQATGGADRQVGMGSWGSPVRPSGYICTGFSRQELPSGGVAIFQTYKEAGYILRVCDAKI